MITISSPIRLSFISKLLNVSKAEIGRVSTCWFLNFFLRFAFVIGWTVLTGMFVSRFGIANLPYLFITNALFIIFGTALYSEVVHRVKKEILIIASVLLAALALLIAQFFSGHWLFFAFLIIAESVFLSQLYILIGLFAEHLFSPLESQRTFPVIESSETLGALFGGLFVAMTASHIPAYKFIYVLILLLLLMIPIIFIFKKTQKIPSLDSSKNKDPLFKNVSQLKRITEGARLMQKKPFLKALVAIVLCQWIFIGLLEFQYTKAVEQSVSHSEEPLIVTEEAKFSFSLVTNKNLYKQSFTAEPHHGVKLFETESKLIQNLGSLHVLFGASALFIQLLIASRLISTLGVAGSILLHPVVMIFSLIGLTLQFGFPMAVLARNNFEISNVIFRSAYHSSFYVILENFRSEAKEFLEGLVRPFGSVIGMLLLILCARIYTDSKFVLSVNELMTFTALVMIWAGIHFQKHYTQLAKRHLLTEESGPEKLHAIEILSQKGHDHAALALTKFLYSPNENVFCKMAVLKALGNIGDYDSIPAILDAFKDKSKRVRKAAILALMSFKGLNKNFSNKVIFQYKIISSLKELFKREISNDIRTQIIRLLSKFNQADVVGFLFDVMNNSNRALKVVSIKYCKNFNDISVSSYIEPYLSSKDPILKASAIIALWHFDKFKPELKRYIDEMFNSRLKSVLLAVIYAVSEIDYTKKNHILMKLLNSKDNSLKLAAALALAKLDRDEALHILIGYYLDGTKVQINKIKDELNNFSQACKENFDKLLYHEVSFRINKLCRKHNVTILSDCSPDLLLQLQRYYSIINEFSEIARIQAILDHKALANT